MTKKFKYTFVFKAGNVFTKSLLALGIRFNGSVLITVPGRKTGQPHSTPITMVEVDGRRYVQSPFGNVDWVRNLRVAQKATLSWGHHHDEVTVSELSPEKAAPIIKWMLGHAPKMIRDYFDVTAESSLEAIERDAPNHAVFAVNADGHCRLHAQRSLGSPRMSGYDRFRRRRYVVRYSAGGRSGSDLDPTLQIAA